jgi:hypothetical protein
MAQMMAMILVFSNIADLRQIGTTGNLRMTRMRKFRLACRANQCVGPTHLSGTRFTFSCLLRTFGGRNH